MGIDAPETYLQKSIKNIEDRKKEKKAGLKAKARLKELLKIGGSQPEGLFIKTFFDKKGKYGRVLGDIKYVYAKDLFNHNPNSKPWVGWKSINNQLLAENLVKSIKK